MLRITFATFCGTAKGGNAICFHLRVRIVATNVQMMTFVRGSLIFSKSLEFPLKFLMFAKKKKYNAVLILTGKYSCKRAQYMLLKHSFS
jgi:hypothetical protein